MDKKDYAVPLTIQSEISARVVAFNEKYQIECRYYPYIRGKFIYLTREGIDGSFKKICRLTYNGDLEKMDFAIFRYSSETTKISDLFLEKNFLMEQLKAL